MSRRSYLRRVAKRAALQPAAVVPPRRLVRAAPVSAAEEMPHRADVAAPAPPAHPIEAVVADTVRSEEAVAAPPAMNRKTTPDDEPRPVVIPARRVRPPADFTFTDVRRPLPPRERVDHIAPRSSEASDPSVAQAPPTPESTSRQEPPAPLPRSVARATTPPRNPLAAALTAAFKWTASESPQLPPRVSERSSSTREPAPQRAHVVPAKPVATPAVERARRGTSTAEDVRPASRSARASRTAAAVGTFTNIRIGAVDVEIQQAPVPPPPPPARARAASSQATPSLSRSLTSAIGLRQS